MWVQIMFRRDPTRWVAAFAVLLLSIWARTAAHASSSPVEVETAVTYASAFQPELHFLLTNHTSRSIPFYIDLGWTHRSYASPEEYRNAMLCTRVWIDDKYGLEQGIIWDELGYETVGGRGRGVLRPGQWLHRALSLGPSERQGGCRIPFRINFAVEDIVAISGVVDLPEKPFARYQEVPLSDALKQVTTRVTVEAGLVEKRVNVQLVLRNPSSRAIRFEITNRGLECQGAQANWVWRGYFRPPPELEVGPMRVQMQSWAAFLIPINILDIARAKDCSAWFEISTIASRNHAASALPRVTVNLMPTADPNEFVCKQDTGCVLIEPSPAPAP